MADAGEADAGPDGNLPAFEPVRTSEADAGAESEPVETSGADAGPDAELDVELGREPAPEAGPEDDLPDFELIPDTATKRSRGRGDRRRGNRRRHPSPAKTAPEPPPAPEAEPPRRDERLTPIPEFDAVP